MLGALIANRPSQRRDIPTPSIAQIGYTLDEVPHTIWPKPDCSSFQHRDKVINKYILQLSKMAYK